MPGFGTVVLEADNNGTGWYSSVQGGVLVYMNYELAVTQANRLGDKIRAYTDEGYAVPAEFTDEYASRMLVPKALVLTLMQFTVNWPV